MEDAIETKSKVRYRVIDFLSNAKNSDWNAQNPTWNFNMLMYDKKFTTVEACIGYDKAAEAGNLEEAWVYREKIYQIVDEAFASFSEYIINAPEANYEIEGKNILDYLALVKNQISDAK